MYSGSFFHYNYLMTLMLNSFLISEIEVSRKGLYSVQGLGLFIFFDLIIRAGLDINNLNILAASFASLNFLDNSKAFAFL